MNKALILLLVTLVQSQSDGVLLPNTNTDDRFRDSQLEDWEVPESTYAADVNKDYDQSSQPFKKRSMTSDAFTRRSSLDKNFMRFGRGQEPPESHCTRGPSSGKLSFYRFGRGLKDGFIRFGRARDNFIRFGRGGSKDGFIRFGRSRPEDFFRPVKSLKDNFIRFGKAYKTSMRFSSDGGDEDYEDSSSAPEESFRRLEKSTRAQDNFMRFGKNGKNGTNFLRFGKSDEGEERYAGDGGAGKRGERKRRSLEAEEPPWLKGKRGPGFFETPPEGFPRRFLPIPGSPSQDFPSFSNSRLTPFFPGFPSFGKSSDFGGAEAKRNQGGSNFIRFG